MNVHAANTITDTSLHLLCTQFVHDTQTHHNSNGMPSPARKHRTLDEKCVVPHYDLRSTALSYIQQYLALSELQAV